MSMGTRAKLNAPENDGLTGAKRYYHFKPGMRAWLKATFWGRRRAESRVQIVRTLADANSNPKEPMTP